MFKTFFGQTRNQQIFLKISSFLVITSLVFLNQLVSPLVAEAAVLFSNGFENNFNSWDIASGQWGINASSPHSGSRKARVNGSKIGRAHV